MSMMNKKEKKMKLTKFRTIKISAGMTQEFEIINTNAPDNVILKQLMYLSDCQENLQRIPIIS